MGLATVHRTGFLPSATSNTLSRRQKITRAIEPAAGRLIQVAVALSVVPALVFVVAVGAVTMLAIAVRDVIWGSVCHDVCAPRERVGSEIFRS